MQILFACLPLLIPIALVWWFLHQHAKIKRESKRRHAELQTLFDPFLKK